MKIGIVRFSTQVVKTGIVSASSVPITKTQSKCFNLRNEDGCF